MENRKAIRCVVAGEGGTGPTFFPVVVLCHAEEFANGLHYEAAKAAALEAGYSPYLVYDEKDGPTWLFLQFVASSYAVVDIDGEEAHAAGFGLLA